MGDPGVVTRSVETVESFDTMESGESAGSGSVYGRRNPWGNQSYADLITQVSSSIMCSEHLQITFKLFLTLRPFPAARRGG